MNPLTQIRNRIKLRKDEVLSSIPESASYHSQYKNSAYIYAGQLSFKLTEGDILAIFSQYGEVVDVNLIRNKETGESRGFAYLAYEDQRSTDLAVDNLNGAEIAGRVMAVDHVLDYKRLIENPEAEADLPPPPVQERASESASGAILAGAEAEAAEDAYGVTTDAGERGEPAGGPPRSRAIARGGAPANEPWQDGNSSVAAMLREAESMLAVMKRKRSEDGDAAVLNDEDPLAMMRHSKVHIPDKKESKEKKEKKDKKEKKEKKEKKDKAEKEGHRDNKRQDPTSPHQQAEHSAPSGTPRNGGAQEQRSSEGRQTKARQNYESERRQDRPAYRNDFDNRHAERERHRERDDGRAVHRDDHRRHDRDGRYESRADDDRHRHSERDRNVRDRR